MMTKKPLLKRGLTILAAGAVMLASAEIYRQQVTARGIATTTVGEEDDLTRIPGFNSYRLTPLRDEGEVKELYSYLRSDLGFDIWDRCSDRAHVWSYQLWKTRAVNSGKVFIFYTDWKKPDLTRPGSFAPRNPYNRPWVWHVAPYVVADNKAYVLEKLPALMNDSTGQLMPALDRPLLLDDWISLQTNGDKCVELKGNEKDLSRFYCGGLNKNGKCSGASRVQVAPDSGIRCYYRRVPMHYYYPASVGNRDYLGETELTQMSSGSVYNACLYSLSGNNGLLNLAKGSRKRMPKTIKRQCNTFTQDPMTSFGPEWIPPANFTPARMNGTDGVGSALIELPYRAGAETSSMAPM